MRMRTRLAPQTLRPRLRQHGIFEADDDKFEPERVVAVPEGRHQRLRY